MWREVMNKKGQREIKTGKKLEEMKLWGVKNGKGHTVSDGGMQNERKKKDQGEDYRAEVREKPGGCITSPCQSYFDNLPVCGTPALLWPICND